MNAERFAGGLISTKRKNLDPIAQGKELAQKLVSLVKDEPEWLPKHRRIPSDLRKLQDPVKSANLCGIISNSMRDISYLKEDYEGPLLDIVEESPGTEFLSYHVANKFTGEDGKDYVIDFTYSQIDDSVELPYVAPLQEWRANVLEASVNPKQHIREKLYDEFGKPRVKNLQMLGEPEKSLEALIMVKAEMQVSDDPKHLAESYEHYKPLKHSYPSIFMEIAKNPNTPEHVLQELAGKFGLTGVHAKKNLSARGLL